MNLTPFMPPFKNGMWFSKNQEATYALTQLEGRLFQPAMGPDFGIAPHSSIKGFVGQYYYRPEPATWGLRGMQVAKGAPWVGIGGAFGSLYLYNRMLDAQARQLAQPTTQPTTRPAGG